MRPEFAPFRLELRTVAVKQLGKLSDLDAERIQGALERMAELGIGDIKDVGDDYPGKFRLRVRKLRISILTTGLLMSKPSRNVAKHINAVRGTNELD